MGTTGQAPQTHAEWHAARAKALKAQALRDELGRIGARLNEIQGSSPWQPTPNHPEYGAEVARLNRRSVEIIRALS